MAKFVPFERIVVANSFTVASPYPLWQIEELADLYQSKVHFLHVENPDEETAVSFAPWGLMDELSDKEPKVSYPFVVSAVKDKDITHGILEYAREIDANLIVTVNELDRPHSRAFHETLTQDVTLRSELPLLVVHTERKKQS